ncbi:hypothetical protein CYY_010084 [Polysphondylium violaceum]|uniref:Peptidase S1 domain-containing protein n=1 Tax=Polysphondylium violaceum TaxID=133409 RepID=A0A8J4PJJ2_9MYCE|nr:hypothetical protein CYY_010084 [Polysphondylium violaceum]
MDSISFRSDLKFDVLNNYDGYSRKSVSGLCQFTYPNPVITANWPISTIGQIKTKINGLNKETFFGTGALVGPNQVLTCGHNLVNEDKDTRAGTFGWSSEVYFSIKDSQGRLQEIKATHLLVHPEYRKTRSPKYDVGLLILEKEIGYELGWMGIFSADPDYSQGYSRSTQVFTNGFSSKSEEKQFELSKDIKSIKLTNSFEYTKVPTEKGQSGSPIWKRWPSIFSKQLVKNSDLCVFVFGIHTQEGKGVEITSELFNLIVSTIKSSHIYKDVGLELNPYIQIRDLQFDTSSQKPFLNQAELETDPLVKESFYRKSFLCTNDFDTVAAQKYANLLVELYSSTKDSSFICEAYNLYFKLKSYPHLFDTAEANTKLIESAYPFWTGDTKNLNFLPDISTKIDKKVIEQPPREINKSLVYIVTSSFEQAQALNSIFQKFGPTYQVSESVESKFQFSIQISNRPINIIVTFQNSISDLKDIFNETPALVLNVGLCAGNLSSDKNVYLGDIIIAKKAFFYDGGKRTNTGDLRNNNSEHSSFADQARSLMEDKTNWKAYPVIEKQPDHLKHLIYRVLYSIGENNSDKYLEDYDPKKMISSYKVLSAYKPTEIVRELDTMKRKGEVKFDQKFILSDTLKETVSLSLQQYGQYPLSYSNESPKALFGTFGCGTALEEKVEFVDNVKKSAAFIKCQEFDYETIAIDKETADFYKVGNDYNTSKFLSIKSVSDYADDESNSYYHPFCYQVTASYSLELIQNYFLNN